MVELRTEFLRMWQHCPLQAVLCTKHAIRPVDVAARAAITLALGQSAPDGRSPRFKSDKVAKAFDRAWQDYQLRFGVMDLATFYALGEKWQARANAVAGVLNRAIDDGWSYVDGAHDLALPLEDVIGEPGRSWRLVHRVDALLRDPARRLCLTSFSLTSTLRFINVRELNQNLDIQLNNLTGARCLAEPYRCGVISTNKERLLPATLDPADTRRAAGWLADVVRSIQYGIASHRPISELSCGYCPVQTLCDDPEVYAQVQQGGQIVP